MSNDTREPASRVVGAFRELLGDDLREGIGEERLHELQGMIQEALAEQAEAILGRLEENLRNLRSEVVERRPLEL